MPKGNKPIPAEMAMLFPVCIPRNGCPKKEEPGVLGSRKGGGRWPAGRVGIEGSFLIWRQTKFPITQYHILTLDPFLLAPFHIPVSPYLFHILPYKPGMLGFSIVH